MSQFIAPDNALRQNFLPPDGGFLPPDNAMTPQPPGSSAETKQLLEILFSGFEDNPLLAGHPVEKQTLRTAFRSHSMDPYTPPTLSPELQKAIQNAKPSVRGAGLSREQAELLELLHIQNQPTVERSLPAELATALVRGARDTAYGAMTAAVGAVTNSKEALALSSELRGDVDTLAPSRDDFKGTTLNLVGSFVPAVLAGPLGFGGVAYESVLKRTQGNGKAAAGAGLVGAALGAIPPGLLLGFGIIPQAIAKKFGLGRVSKEITEHVLESMIAGGANVGIAHSTEAIARAGGATPQDVPWVEEFVAGSVGQLGLSIGARALRDRHAQQAFRTAKARLVEAGMFSPDEITLIGNRPDLFAEIATRRAAGNEVTIKPKLASDGSIERDSRGEANLRIRIVPDIVTPQEKAAFEHNPEAIAEYRKHLKNNGERFFVDPSTLTPEPAETASVLERLRATQQKTALQPGDLTPNDLPATERGLYVRDIAMLGELIRRNPTDRSLLNQAEALLRETSRASSEKPLDPDVAAATTVTPQVLTPIKLAPVQRWIGPVGEFVGSGYFKRASQLAKSPKVQRQITKLQRQLIQRLSVLKNDAQLSPIQKVIGAKLLDADYTAKVETALTNDTNSPKVAKAKLKKLIVDTTPPENQTAILQAIDETVDKATKQGLADTQREVFDHVIETLANPILDVPPAVQYAVELAYRDEFINPNARTISERWRDSYDRLRGVMENMAGFGLEKLRSEVSITLKDLPGSATAKYLHDALTAKTTKDLQEIAKDVAVLQETYLRKIHTERILSEVKRAEKNLNRDKIYQTLRNIDNTRVPVVTNPKTGYATVDLPILKESLTNLSVDRLINLQNQLTRLNRRGAIEKGLYNRILGYSNKQDTQKATNTLARYSDRSDLQQRFDAVTSVAKTLIDPAMTEVTLLELAGGDKQNVIYRILHSRLLPGWNRHQQNVANMRRFVGDVATRTLGISASNVRGQYKLARYLAKKLPSGLSRDQAMRVYAWSTDSGRAADLVKYGVKTSKGEFDAEVAMSGLTDADMKFVDEVKTHFVNNPYSAKAARNIQTLTGRSVRFIKGYFPSSRVGPGAELRPDFDTLTTSLLRDIDPMMDRVDHATSPFDVTTGFLSSFYQASETTSIYGEVGLELHRAQRLLRNSDFRIAVEKKLGHGRLKQLDDYVAELYPLRFRDISTADTIINQLTAGRAISKTALNLFSALKQFTHILTMYGDGTLSAASLTQAIAEGSWLNPSVAKRMQRDSGMAYMRYTAGQYMKHFLVMADDGKLPGGLELSQYYSMVLQRNFDRRVMQVAWRAAELDAQKAGLKGIPAREYTLEKFTDAAGRDQPTDNPLYSSPLEIYAKKHPPTRSILSFQRETNRIYNVMRRHVGQAIQNPTQETLQRAIRAILFAGVGQLAMVTMIDQLRRVAFRRDTGIKTFLSDAVGNFLGLWYASGPAELLADALLENREPRGENLVGVVPELALSVVNGSLSLIRGITADPDETIPAGPERGGSVRTKHFTKALDSALSVHSAIYGLPIWSLWMQGRNLYRWTRDDIVLMTQLEKEFRELKDSGKTTNSRYRQLEQTKKDINAIHRLRESGRLPASRAQQQIRQKIERVMP